MRVTQFGRVDAGFGERLPVEDEAAVLADHAGDVLVIDGTHGQAELGDAVAAEDVLVVVVQRVGARLCEQRVKAVFGVRLAGAGLPAEHHVVRRVHRHLEVHGAVAAVNGLQVLRQNSRLRGRELESVVVVAFA